MRNIYLVSDDNEFIDCLSESLNNLDFNLLGVSANGLEAISELTTLTPNIVLIDLNINGVLTPDDIVIKVHDEFQLPVVLLGSSIESNMILQAVKVEPDGFITRPYEDANLFAVIELALNKRSNSHVDTFKSQKQKKANGILFVKKDDMQVKIKTADIYWIKALDNYVEIITSMETLIIRNTLKDISKILSEKEFVRIHRSFIVRIDKIDAFKENNAVVHNTMIPIGRSYKENLQNQLMVI